MSDKPTDAVAQARAQMLFVMAQVAVDAYEYPGERSAENAKRIDDAVAAYDAAVRAECAAKVREVRSVYTNEPYSNFAQGWHEACDAITRKVEAP